MNFSMFYYLFLIYSANISHIWQWNALFYQCCHYLSIYIRFDHYMHFFVLKYILVPNSFYIYRGTLFKYRWSEKFSINNLTTFKLYAEWLLSLPQYDKTNICAVWSGSMLFAISFSTCNRVCKLTAWILIRPWGCAGWSGSMLVANALSWFCHGGAHIYRFWTNTDLP
jgi:hypothetical protein